MNKIRNLIMKMYSLSLYIILPILNKNIKIQAGLNVRKNVFFNANGGKIIIGKGAFINSNSSINAKNCIEIGDYFLAGENVHIYDHNHVFNDKYRPIAEQGFRSAPVKIGNNVWVGSNVTILMGVTIGNNCVIGANCLIYKDVAEDTIVKCNQNLILEERGKNRLFIDE